MRDQTRAKTRRAIVAAASDVFLERSYLGTTIAAIADRAGVSSRFVHMSFEGKAALLAEAIQVAVVGDDRPIALQQRAEWQAMLQVGGASSIEAFTRLTTEISNRVAGLLAVADVAAAVDAHIARMRERARVRRRADCATVIAELRRRDQLASGLSARDAADILYALSAPGIYLMLVHERQWSQGRYRRWLTQTAQRALLV